MLRDCLTFGRKDATGCVTAKFSRKIFVYDILPSVDAGRLSWALDVREKHCPHRNQCGGSWKELIELSTLAKTTSLGSDRRSGPVLRQRSGVPLLTKHPDIFYEASRPNRSSGRPSIKRLRINHIDNGPKELARLLRAIPVGLRLSQWKGGSVQSWAK